MLKALIRKQFLELFKGYFVDRKTGKPRKKSSVILMFALFALLMLVLCGAFYGMAWLMGDLLYTGMEWLYYAIMGMIAIAMGVFGSVFNTYAGLYLAKDNELLIPMPIPAGTILLSRLAGVVGLSFLYSALVWLPTVIFAWVAGAPSALAVVNALLLTLVITFFVSVLTCLLGWVVAVISKRLKNKSFITVIVSVAFFAGYYTVCFRMNDIIMNMVANADKMAGTIRTWLNLIYMLGMASTGDVQAMLVFTGITAVLSVGCYVIMSRTFMSLATGGQTHARAKGTARAGKPRSLKKALFIREAKRFAASPTYMLNCGLGVAIAPAIAVIACVRYAALREMLASLAEMLPGFGAFVPLLIPVIVCMVMVLNCISTPSVSLEGDRLWILKTIPVGAADILMAKLLLHIAVNLPAAILASVLLCIAMQIRWYIMLAILVLTGLFICLTGIIGLIIGLKRPNLRWTSEQIVIKQSLNVLFSYLAGLALMILMGGGAYLLRNTVQPVIWMAVFACLEGVASLVLLRYLKKGGAALFGRH